MKSNLITAIEHYLGKTGRKASHIEQQATLANGTIARVLKGGALTKETLGKLLEVIPSAYGEEWAVAFLKDNCPDDFREKIAIMAIHPSFTPVDDIDRLSSRDRFQRNLDALRSLGMENKAVIDWVNDTCSLLFKDQIDTPKDFDSVATSRISHVLNEDPVIYQAKVPDQRTTRSAIPQRIASKSQSATSE